MKRPLCFVSLIIAAAAFLYLEFFSENLMETSGNVTDGMFTEVVGTVSYREYRRDFQGQILPVIYLKPEDPRGDQKIIQCYMESSDGYEPKVGERVKICGKVRVFTTPRNPGEFNSLLYYSTLKISYRLTSAQVLARGGTRSAIKEALCRLKFRLEEVLDNTLSAEDSSVMKAILLGDKTYMDTEVKELYQSCGVIHIMAVSGMHVFCIAMGLYNLLRSLGTRRSIASALCITVIYGYGVMCGMSTSAFRAILMFAVRLIAPEVKRTYDILSALALAGILLILDQPLYLYNSGFWFSFGAIIGIAYLRPALEPVFKRHSDKLRFADEERPPFPILVIAKLSEDLLTALAVFLSTLPVYVTFYHTYPLCSFLLNLIVLPLMAPLMGLGIFCMVVGAFASVLCIIPAGIIHVILKLFTILCNSAAFLPIKTWYIGHSSPVRIIIYIFLLVLFTFIPVIKKNLIRRSFLLIPLAIIILCFNLKPDLKISMIDVGQGDGILIESKASVILIDGGSTSNKQVGKYSIIPYLKYEGVGKIDLAVVTHEDMDHISGLLEIMDDMERGGIKIEALMLPDITDDIKGDNYMQLEGRAKELNIPVTYISENKEFSMEKGKLSFTCLNPDRNISYDGANAYSTVLFMKYGEFTALFTGDVEGAGQENLVQTIKESGDKYRHIDLLKVAHHGSEYTTDMEFLKLVAPGYALISCGRDNSYGHPHRELLERLKEQETRIYRTDECGEISVDIYGDTMDITPFISKGIRN